ncbi:hypothetical protein [Streptomyces alanosinicus]|nr:hypothetical protein [Streptomyces alanosinicus]
MSSHPLVVVEAPDGRGLRVVRVRGERVGRAWSPRGARRLLRRAGLPADLDLDDPGQVRWVADRSCWPDRPVRRRAAGVLMALGLLASAAVLSYVGMSDAFNALAYGGRVVGVTFVAAALAEAVATVAVADYWGKRASRYSGAAVLVGVATVTLTNLMFLITQIQGGDYTPFLLLWIALVLWVVWSLWTLTRQGVWRQIPHPKGVALGVVVSGAVGLASLAYSQMYVPYSTPVRIPFGVSFGDPTLSADGTVLHVPAHVEFRNAGSVRISLVGTMWTVRGWPTRFTEKGTRADVWKRELLNDDETVRHVVYAPSRMLGTGRLAEPGDWLDPGDDVSGDFVVDVPLSAGFGRIEAGASVSFIRADRGTLGNDYADSGEASWDTEHAGERHLRDAPDWVANQGDDFIRYSSKVYHSSEMLNLTHRTDYATAWSVLRQWYEGADFAKGDTSPELVVTISRDRKGVEHLSDSEQAPYGMKTEDRWTERTVDQLLKAARK